MSDTEARENSLHSRALSGIHDLIERGMNYVNGVERTIAIRAIQILQPKIEEKIRSASEEDLRTELRYVHNLLGSILMEPTVKETAKQKTTTARKANMSAQGSSASIRRPSSVQKKKFSQFTQRTRP